LRSNVDMTQGRPLNVIFSFALPLLMGNLFNQLYNVVDTAIVGRALGADALAAVGSTGNINACLFLLLAGLATDVSVIVSQYWGAERYDELRRLLGTFLTLLLAASVVMSLLGVLLAFASLLAPHLGVWGIWLATPLSWASGCIIPVVRYYSKEWMKRTLI
ncbi:MAG: MATE family efflux transporter, partial [Ruminococcus sp.]|nr:MATE family efflux transporter [Ruminococcus sp.]